MNYRASFCDPFKAEIKEIGDIPKESIIELFEKTPWSNYLIEMEKGEKEVHYSPSLEIENKDNKNGSENTIKAPLPGTVISIGVSAGDKVKEGDSLVKLVAMKMENDVVAQRNGIVKEVKIKKNDSVNTGDTLIILEWERSN